MTRINCVPVKELCNKHLFAEWRELPRIQSYLTKTLQKEDINKVVSKISPKYILGTGHVKFFYDKLFWLSGRYEELTLELLERGYNIEPRELVLEAPEKLFNNWKPSQEYMELNRQRTQDRLPKNPKYSVVKRK